MQAGARPLCAIDCGSAGTIDRRDCLGYVSHPRARAAGGFHRYLPQCRKSLRRPPPCRPRYIARGAGRQAARVKRSTVHDRYATDQYGATAIIRRYSNVAELFVDLALGRNDAILVEVDPARVGFLQTPLGADCEFVGPEISGERWFGTGIGIAVRKGDNARREALNHALAAIRADGSYQRIITRYFNSE